MDRRLGWALVLASVSAVLVALHFARSGAERPRVAAEISRPERAPPAPSSISAPGLEPEKAPARDVVENALSTEPEAPPESAAHVAPVLRGRVVLTDPDARPIERWRGTLALRLHRFTSEADGGPRRAEPLGGVNDIAIVDGEWSTALDARAASISVERVSVDGRIALVDGGPRQRAIPEQHVLEIEARLPHPSALVVVDARSRAPLADLTLVVGAPRGMESTHPGNERGKRPVHERLTSPIALDALLPFESGTTAARIFVGAPGYAWERIDLDLSRGGERIAVLEAGGALEVSLAGPEVPANAFLRLYADGALAPAFEEPFGESRSMRVDGLHPGSIRAALEVGDRWRGPETRASALVAIVAGRASAVTLELAAPRTRELVAVSGVLRVPKAWGITRPFVQTRPLDGGTRYRAADTLRCSAIDASREGFDEFAWSARLAPGKHLLSLLRPVWSARIDVPDGGLEGCVLELPPPCELSVRVVDAESSRELDVELGWNPKRDEPGNSEMVRRDPASGRYLVRAPCGAVVLSVWDFDYEPVEAELDLASGVREHTLALQPACSVRVTLRDGEAIVPWPDGADVLPEPAEGTPGRTGLVEAGAQRRFQLTAPGAYTLRAPKLDGYVEPGVTRFTVARCERKELVIELQRERR